MAKILNPTEVQTVNVDIGAVTALEGWGIDLNSLGLAGTSADTVAVGLIMTPVTSGVIGYGQATGQDVECAVGNVLVEIDSSDAVATFNDTNYSVGGSVGFTDGKFAYNATSKRGVVVANTLESGSLVRAVVLIDKVLG